MLTRFHSTAVEYDSKNFIILCLLQLLLLACRELTLVKMIVVYACVVLFGFVAMVVITIDTMVAPPWELMQPLSLQLLWQASVKF